MLPPANMIMRSKIATASKRLIGFAFLLIPAHTFRTSGRRLTINAARKRKVAPNTMAEPINECSRAPILGSIPSMNSRKRITNGRARRKLIIAADLGFVRMVFIAYPW